MNTTNVTEETAGAFEVLNVLTCFAGQQWSEFLTLIGSLHHIKLRPGSHCPYEFKIQILKK